MSTNKLYVVNYHEVQIAGYRIFSEFDQALKEYLKHCILETQSLLLEDDDEKAEVEELSSEEVSDVVEEEEEEEDEEFDEMSCSLEIQELEGKEFVTAKEFDYQFFEENILEKNTDDLADYLVNLEKLIDDNAIPSGIVALFK
jgi:predicted AlkP superfamily phosphohydrolase/phosphomutase